MNINLDDVEHLIRLAERSNIESLEITDGDKRIVIVCYDSSKTLQSSTDIDNTGKSTTQSTDVNQSTSKQIIDASQTIANIQTKDNQAAGVSQLTDSDVSTVIAPMMGTFYLRSDPSAKEFVNEGDKISAGDTLCIIEAMKIMHEVKAEGDCVIDKILIKEGDIVEFDQPLFEIRPI